MAALNAALTRLFDAVLAPAVRFAPLTTLAVVSALTGVAMLWVVKRTSNQQGMAAAKRAIQAALFEIRLFNDNPAAVLRALGRVLWHNARYLGYSLVPLAWAALPLLLVVAQLQAFYGYEGLAPGAPAVVTATLRNAQHARDAAAFELGVPDDIRLETPAVMLPGAGEVVWRIVPRAAGRYELMVRAGGEAVSKTLLVSTEAGRRSPFRVSALVDQLLYPSESPLSAHGDVVEIAVPYGNAAVAILGWRLHWTIVYLLLSMATAFALARRSGVVL